MKLALRVLLLFAVFAGVGFFSYRAVFTHSIERYGAYAPETRLAAMMAGLFAGGAATVVTGIALAFTARRP